MSKTISEWQKEVFRNSKEHGFHDGIDPIQSIPLKLALIHSEVSECLEEFRRPDFVAAEFHRCEHGVEAPSCKFDDCWRSKPEGFPAELADVFIRLLDLAEQTGVDLEEAVRVKHDYNLHRPYKHGKTC